MNKVLKHILILFTILSLSISMVGKIQFASNFASSRNIYSATINQPTITSHKIHRNFWFDVMDNSTSEWNDMQQLEAVPLLIGIAFMISVAIVNVKHVWTAVVSKHNRILAERHQYWYILYHSLKVYS